MDEQFKSDVVKALTLITELLAEEGFNKYSKYYELTDHLDSMEYNYI